MVLRFFMLAAAFFLSCTEVQRDNPYDSGGINFRGNSFPSDESSSSEEKPSSSSEVVYSGFCCWVGNEGNNYEGYCGPISANLTLTYCLQQTGKQVTTCDGCNTGSSQGLESKGNDITKYKTKQIGSQTWMVENLDYDIGGAKCYNNSASNCAKYGRLYDWETAKTVCPSGWRLPSNDDWDKLVRTAGGTSVAGKHLKATSGWNNGNGTDIYEFAALPGGSGIDYDPGVEFDNVGEGAFWWSSESTYDRAWIIDQDSGDGVRTWRGRGWGTSMYSVRCVKN